MSNKLSQRKIDRVPGLRSSPGLVILLGCLAFLPACTSLTNSNGGAPTSSFTLQSPGRVDNAMLESRYGGNMKSNPNCGGENLSPALAWSHAPVGTRSFAILMDDQAGRAGLGVSHWVAYGIASSTVAMAEGEASTHSTKFVPGRNSVGADIYLGPCPPLGNAPQHYVFTLIATKIEPDALRPGLTKPELLEALKGKTIAAASAVLRYAH